MKGIFRRCLKTPGESKRLVLSKTSSLIRILKKPHLVLSLIVRFLQWSLQAVVDFLIEDRCILCGSSRCSALNSIASSRSFSRCLLQVVHIRIFWMIPLENHPICGKCAVGFDEARSAGILGKTIDGKAVETAGGDWFEVQPEGLSNPGIAGGIPSHNVGKHKDIIVIAPFMTNDNVLKLIHLVKFSGYRNLIPLIVSAIVEAYRTFLPYEYEPSIIAPVPMDRRSKRLRGFNQAEIIGLELSRLLGIPMDSSVLLRLRQGKRQSQTPREKRADNVRGAFGAVRERAVGKHVLLVDDLVTSGATAAACASALISSGAASVRVLCFGRSL